MDELENHNNIQYLGVIAKFDSIQVKFCPE